jgi:hypothetical protein
VWLRVADLAGKFPSPDILLAKQVIKTLQVLVNHLPIDLYVNQV